MQEIKLTLTVEEVNQILDGLGSQPFKSVFKLIGKIQHQAGTQLQDGAQQLGMPEKRAAPDQRPNEPVE